MENKEKFKNILIEKKQLIENELEKFLDEKQKDLEVTEELAQSLYDYLREEILSEGKRLRPIATIMSYQAFNGKFDDKILLPSLSTEMCHNATLILDDLMDEDDVRRNIETTHAKLGKWYDKKIKDNDNKTILYTDSKSRFAISTAILAADIVYSFGTQTLTNCKYDNEKIKKAIQIYSKTYRELNVGQLLDILYEYKKEITEKDYFDMAKRKTGILLSASMQIGALFGGANEKQIELIDNFAMEAATTFQIQDDLMDFYEDSNKGRPVGSDIKKGKTTLVIIHALNHATPEQKEIIINSLGNENITPEEMQKCIKTIEELGSIEYAKKYAEKKIKKGKEYLNELKPQIEKEAADFFEEFADYMMKRKV